VRGFKDYSDEELLRDFENGDKAVFEEIFNRYWNRLYNVAYRSLRSHEESEEVVQELFVTIWLQRETVKILNLASYLTAAVRKRVVDRIRSKIIHEKYWNYYNQFRPDYREDTENTVAFNELNQEFNDAVGRLPKKSQHVFKLSRMQGLSVPEIASFLNLSERAIEYHITRALKLLRTKLKDFILMACISSFL